MPRSDSLWRHADFLKLWIGQSVSLVGSRVTQFALPLTAALVLGVSPEQMGVLSAVLYAPYAIVGLLAGVWVDRLRRRPVLIAADLGQAALLATIPIAAALGRLSLAQLGVVGFLAGGLAVAGDVARTAYVPTLVSRGRLPEANSRMTTSWAVAGIVGPGIGGALVEALTAPIAIAADVLSFLFSASCLGLIRMREPAPAAARRERRAVRADIAEGLRFLRSDPVLWVMSAAFGVQNFFAAALTAGELLYKTRELHLDPAVLGSVAAGAALIAPVGSALAGPTSRRFGLGRTYVVAITVWCVVQVPLAFAAGPPRVVALLLLLVLVPLRFTEPIWLVAAATIVQTRTPDHMMGRMGGARRFISLGVVPIGFVAGGLLGGAVGLRAAFAITALGHLIPCVWLFASPVRRYRTVADLPANS